MIEIDNSFNTQVSEWIASVTAYIEKYTGRVFESTPSSSKYYDGNEQEELFIDDCVAVSKIEILDSQGNVSETLAVGAGEDFLAYPSNFSYKNSVKLTDNAVYAVFPKGKQNIKVTATFGMASAVPADIELVATKLVAAIVQKGLRGGEISSERLGDYSVSFIEEKAEEMGIKDVLDNYILYEV